MSFAERKEEKLALGKILSFGVINLTKAIRQKTTTDLNLSQ